MDNSLVLRRGTVKDLPQIVQLIKDLNDHQNYALDSPDEKQLLKDGFEHGGAGYTIVAEMTHPNGERELIATVGYALTYFISVGRMANMSGFYVKPSYRHIGLGTKMYQQVLKEVFEEHDCKALAFNTGHDNEPSKRFYKNLGAVEAYEQLKLFPLWHFREKPFEKIKNGSSDIV